MDTKTLLFWFTFIVVVRALSFRYNMHVIVTRV